MAKKALVVGINAYAPPNTLPSCVADAEGMNSLLQGRYAFDSVTMLRDDEATKDRLIAALTELVTNVTSDDRLVFYFSGHGYSYEQDGTTVEALVTQDAHFLNSIDFLALVKTSPPGTLTVVLDSCYSGGLEKIFQVPGKGITKAKVKRWTPPPARAQKPGAAITTPTSAADVASLPYHGFSFSSSDANLEALFTTPTDKAFSLIASPPDRPEDRPFLLVSACMPDETAAASVEGKTQGRSAFTYCLLDRIDRLVDGLSAIDLINAAGAELRDLQLRQTPVLKEPADPPHLGARRFPTLEAMPARRITDKTQPSSPADVEHVNQLLAKTIADILRSGMIQQQQPLTNKGFFDDIAGAVSSIVGGAVNTVENTAGSALSGIFGGGGFSPIGNVFGSGGLAQQVAPLVSMSLKTFATPATSASKGYLAANGQQQQTGQLTARGTLAAAITPVFVQALQNYQAPATLQNKAYSTPQPFDKGWFDSLASIVAQIAPVVIDALKTYQPQAGQPTSPTVSQLQAAAQKGWFDDITHVVATILPTVIDAFKDFKPQNTPAQAQAQAQKGWFDDVLSVVQIAAPLVIAAL